MIETSGTVTALDDDSAFVRISDKGCGRCHEEGGCGGNNLTQMLCATPKVYKVLNPRNARVGDTVVIVMENAVVVRGALVAYVLPLLALFVGAGLGAVFFGDTGSMIGAGVGVVSAWGGLRLRRIRNLFGSPGAQPTIR